MNSGDRIIRVYDAKEILACGKDGDPEPMQRLQDLVNKYSLYLVIILIMISLRPYFSGNRRPFLECVD